jgi:hypothetical protein
MDTDQHGCREASWSAVALHRFVHFENEDENEDEEDDHASFRSPSPKSETPDPNAPVFTLDPIG